MNTRLRLCCRRGPQATGDRAETPWKGRPPARPTYHAACCVYVGVPRPSSPTLGHDQLGCSDPFLRLKLDLGPRHRGEGVRTQSVWLSGAPTAKERTWPLWVHGLCPLAVWPSLRQGYRLISKIYRPYPRTSTWSFLRGPFLIMAFIGLYPQRTLIAPLGLWALSHGLYGPAKG